MEDILDIPVTSLDPNRNPNFQRAVEELYHAHGKSPVYSGFYHSNFQLRYIQMTENCIHITDDFWTYTPDDFSKKIPLKDHFNGIICAWQPNAQKNCLKNFLNLLPDQGSSSQDM